MVNINQYIKALLHAAGGHQGSHKAHQAGNQVFTWGIFVFQVHTELSWSPTSQGSLILIGDNRPHELGDNPRSIDWRQEADTLNEMVSSQLICVL